jgi:hypothetical protein
MVQLTWSDALGKRVRTGDWDEQAVPTITLIEEAIREGDHEKAAQLIDYFMEEAKLCYQIYDEWLTGLREWLLANGIGDEELERELASLRTLLALPDGSRFVPQPLWSHLATYAGRLANGLRLQSASGASRAEAIAGVDGIREDWRRLHDRWVDLLSGLFTLVAKRFGEERLEHAYRHLLEPYIQRRYMPFDLRENRYEDTVYRNLYTAFEAMRAHLVGPARRGDVELAEHDDRWVLSFDPCGSGGRTQRGDPLEETGPRPEPPYNFGVTRREYNWAWNEKGVCYYCAHCCFALERMPAERWGHPVRVVDSPLYPQETAGETPKKCTWTIYKSVEAIPEEAYRRIGMTKPRTSEAGDVAGGR